ncbi:MAG TPA: carotenoid oxygenase family protein, partial [Hyphomonadaceae bacterium]|nr:carotenoid oxygenase family protein [Hyphomonadaceae bacterium]
VHPMNAWEEGSKIHTELMEYPTAPLFPNADGSKGENSQAVLRRWTIDLDGPGNVKRETLDDLPSEFPRPDERFAGLPYRHGWYVANVGHRNPLVFNSIAHIDHKTGKRVTRTYEPGDAVGEPIFVPRVADAPEGDGHLLVLVYRAATNTSELQILNAQDIAGKPEAVLKLPRRVPSGFHGNWAPGVVG